MFAIYLRIVLELCIWTDLRVLQVFLDVRVRARNGVAAEGGSYNLGCNSRAASKVPALVFFSEIHAQLHIVFIANHIAGLQSYISAHFHTCASCILLRGVCVLHCVLLYV